MFGLKEKCGLSGSWLRVNFVLESGLFCLVHGLGMVLLGIKVNRNSKFATRFFLATWSLRRNGFGRTK